MIVHGPSVLAGRDPGETVPDPLHSAQKGLLGLLPIGEALCMGAGEGHSPPQA